MSQSRPSLEEIFETHIQTLALTRRPATVSGYRGAARRFLSFLRTDFPGLSRLSQLRRDPHLLGWLASLSQQQQPLSNKTRANNLLCLRRLLDDLTANGHCLRPELILRQDFPPQPQYLPRPLSPPDDLLLQQQLRRIDDLPANALLLTRATGIRIGECMDLALDCLRQLGPDQWALHVPLGKLHTERLVPADDDIRQIVSRILALRALAPAARWANSTAWLLPRRAGHDAWYKTLRLALANAATQAGCCCAVTPHRLRHSYASERLRLGVSLPALMRLLGHKDIRMTLPCATSRSRNWTCSASSSPLAAMRPNHIACLRSAFPTSPPPPILLQSVKPSRPHVMSWKCTDASSLTRKHAARSSAWINGYSLSALNWIKSTKPKNEERLAGQGTDHRFSWSVTQVANQVPAGRQTTKNDRLSHISRRPWASPSQE